MTQQRRKGSVLDYLNAIIDSQGGLKTTVIVEVSTVSIFKAAGFLLVAGVGIAFAAHLLKNMIVSKQQLAILNELKKLNK